MIRKCLLLFVQAVTFNINPQIESCMIAGSMYYCHCSVGTCLSNKFILKLLKTLKVNFIESLQKLEFHGVMRFYYQNPDPGSGQKVWMEHELTRPNI